MQARYFRVNYQKIVIHEMAHTGVQPAMDGLYNDMKVVVHQAMSGAPPVVTVANFAQQIEPGKVEIPFVFRCCGRQNLCFLSAAEQKRQPLPIASARKAGKCGDEHVGVTH